MTSPSTPLVLPFEEIGLDDLAHVGGKNASLGEMTGHLAGTGVRVPPGFAVTARAFREHLGQEGTSAWVYATLKQLDVRDVAALARAGKAIRERVASLPLPLAVAAAARAAYDRLSRAHGVEEPDVAVRSSATAEDLPTASFAGQHETYLNIRGWPALDHAIRACFASLFTDRAIVYRSEHGFAHEQVALSVGVQFMVRSDLGSAGVIFTLDTESGFRDVVYLTGSWGIAETLVQGRVVPDEYWVHKPTLLKGHRSLIRRELGSKAVKLVYGEAGGRSVREIQVPEADRLRWTLSEEDVLQLARWALVIEDHYGARAGRPTPMDIEWARDGRTGDLFIVQARPETVHSSRPAAGLEIYRRTTAGKVLLRGKSVGNRVGAGPVRIVADKGELPAVQPGEVLVARMTDPDWEPVLRKVAAVVTDEGGRTCHAAIVSRELGVPCVVGTQNGSRVLRRGGPVTVSCAEGDEGLVYEGTVGFERDLVDPRSLPAPRVPLMLNLGNPDLAFRYAQLPSAGVGLLRIEFVISAWIGVHPMALLHPERVADGGVRDAIRTRIRGTSSGPEFFVERLASGIAQIAAAFFPRPVIVRFSDFKTNEYAGLLGGTSFEPVEANPMLGFRGASRYYDERYREGFALECAAIRRVRHDMGLTNVKVMVPFCRTVTEAQRVWAELEGNGLRRGEEELEVYVMCEIPNNVILADQFSELFDGFSIGSNDLTQLALGIDRDSTLLAHLFDERDPGVKRLVEMVVAEAHRHGRTVGICGQAPSDYPDFAEFLADLGIDSISLNPDSLPEVARRLARSEADSITAAVPVGTSG
jgi:pyruvate,water dikinase